ncbi:hypothetical protein D3C71_1660290 [compost metagenome]
MAAAMAPIRINAALPVTNEAMSILSLFSNISQGKNGSPIIFTFIYEIIAIRPRSRVIMEPEIAKDPTSE